MGPDISEMGAWLFGEQDGLFCLFDKNTGGSFPVGFCGGLRDKMGRSGFPGLMELIE
jgi:hypothetical protein